MAELYRRFSEDFLDFSESMLLEQFHNETYGDIVSTTNGYSVGKKWLNVTVEMWKQDIEEGLLFKWEIEEDFPEWWTRSVLRDLHPRRN
jgi:hypothetical protein